MADYSQLSDEELLQAIIVKKAKKKGIDPILALHVAEQESGFKTTAKSRVGAGGLFQLMPDTAKSLGVNRDDPIENIEGGLTYLKQQLDKFGNEEDALRAYNAGPGRVKQSRKFSETNDYVNKILGRKAARFGNYQPSIPSSPIPSLQVDSANNAGVTDPIPSVTPVGQKRKRVQKVTPVPPPSDSEMQEVDRIVERFEGLKLDAQFTKDDNERNQKLDEARKIAEELRTKFGFEAGGGDWPYVKRPQKYQRADAFPGGVPSGLPQRKQTATIRAKNSGIIGNIMEDIARTGPGQNIVSAFETGVKGLEVGSDIVRSTARGFGNIFAGLPQAVGGAVKLVTDMPVPGSQNAGGRYIAEKGRELSEFLRDQINPTRSEEERASSQPYTQQLLSRKVPEAIGSLGGFAVGGAAGAGLKIPGWLTAAGLGAATNAVSEYEASKESGTTTPEQDEFAGIVGGIIGTAEALGIERILNKLGGRPMVRRAIDALQEGGQEGLTTFLNNLNARDISGYDPTRERSEGVLESIGIGVGSAGLANVPSIIQGRQQRRATDQQLQRDVLASTIPQQPNIPVQPRLEDMVAEVRRSVAGPELKSSFIPTSSTETDGGKIPETITALHAANGGTTFNPARGNLAGTENYAVSIYPERSLTLDGDLAKERPEEFQLAIAEFIDKNNDLLSDERNSIGTWYDAGSGKTYVDVSVTLPSKRLAVALGKRYNQKAIFDLNKFEEIPTGGTGEAVADMPSETERLSEFTPNKKDWTLINYGKTDRKFISPEGQGKGTAIASEQSKRKGPKKTYAYIEGTRPEAAFGRPGQYKRVITGERALYDISADPDGVVKELRDVEGLKGSDFADEMENELKARGYEGYYDSRPEGRGIVTAFVDLPVSRSEKLSVRELMASGTSSVRAAREQRMKEVYNPFVKAAAKDDPTMLYYSPMNIGGKIEDIAKELNKRTIETRGEIPIKAKSPAKIERALEIGQSEIVKQLAEENSGREWYKSDIGTLEKGLIELYPELKDPTQMDFFKILLALTSNGQNPKTNTGTATRIYEAYKENGSNLIPPYQASGTGWIQRAGQLADAINIVNGLIKEGGVKGAVEFVNKKHDANTLTKIRGAKSSISPFAASRGYGSYVFGPKLGSFYQNIKGIETELTMDMWWSRTWNRWMGTLLDSKGDVVPPMPRNDNERIAMTKSVDALIEALNEEGVELSVSEVQAILWVKEQELWKHHGAKVESLSYTDGIITELNKRGMNDVANEIQSTRIGGSGAKAKERGPLSDRRTVGGRAGKRKGELPPTYEEITTRAKTRLSRIGEVFDEASENVVERMNDRGIAYKMIEGSDPNPFIRTASTDAEKLPEAKKIQHQRFGEVTPTGETKGGLIEVVDTNGGLHYIKPLKDNSTAVYKKQFAKVQPNLGAPSSSEEINLDTDVANMRWHIRSQKNIAVPRAYVNQQAMGFLGYVISPSDPTSPNGFAIPKEDLMSLIEDGFKRISIISKRGDINNHSVKTLTNFMNDLAMLGMAENNSHGIIFVRSAASDNTQKLKETIRHEKFHTDQFAYPNREHFGLEDLAFNENITEEQQTYLERAVNSLQHLKYKAQHNSVEIGAYLAGGKDNWKMLFNTVPNDNLTDEETFKAAESLMSLYAETMISHYGLTPENLSDQWSFIDKNMRDVVARAERRRNEEATNDRPKSIYQSKEIGGSEDEGTGGILSRFSRDIPEQSAIEEASIAVEGKKERDSLFKTAMTMRKAGLLTGPRTAFKNITSNATSLMLEEVSKIPASIIDLAISQVTNEKTVTAPNAASIIRSLGEVRKKGWNEFTKAMAGEQTDVDISGWEDIFKEANSDERSKQKELEKFNLYEPNTGFGLMDSYINTVFRFQTAQDRVFRLYAIRRSLEAQSRAIAATEAKKGIIKGSEVADRTAEIIRGNGISNALKAKMATAAIEDAEFALFQNDNFLLQNFIERPIEKTEEYFNKKVPGSGYAIIRGPIEQVMPFRKTPANVIGRVLAYTPVGAAIKGGFKAKQLVASRGKIKEAEAEFEKKKNAPFATKISGQGELFGEKLFEEKSDIEGRKKNESEIEAAAQKIADAIFESRQAQKEFAETIGRGSIGSALILLGWLAGAAGMAAGLVGDRKKKNLQQAANIPEGSINIPGTDKWIKVSDWAPFGTMFAIGASIFEQWDAEAKDARARIINVGKVASEIMLDHPLVAGAKLTLDTIGDPGSASNKAGRAGISQGTSFIPSIVRDVTKTIDPTERQATTLTEEFTRNLPVVSKKVPARTDVLGREIVNPRFASISPAQIRTQRTDAVTKELLKHKIGIPSTVKKGEETPADTLNRKNTKGNKLALMLEEIVKDENYKDMSAADQKLSLQAIVRQAGKSKVKTDDSPLLAADAVRVAHNAKINDRRATAIKELESDAEFLSLSENAREEVKKQVRSLFNNYSVDYKAGFSPNSLRKSVEMADKKFAEKGEDFFNSRIAKIKEFYLKRRR